MNREGPQVRLSAEQPEGRVFAGGFGRPEHPGEKPLRVEVHDEDTAAAWPSAAARWIDVVVFPVPPLWLQIVRTGTG